MSDENNPIPDPKPHVEEGSEMARNASTPSRPLSVKSGSAVYTTTSQKKRYTTISGIESDTSYQEYQWPEFAMKELGDNCSDFFKIFYPKASANDRKIAAKITIVRTMPTTKLLHIAMRNSNVNNFEIFENLAGVFDYDNWVSTKRNQHRMTAGGLGDFLKRVLGMGYASWTSDYNPEDSFEDKQWPEPVILRFNGKEYYAYLIVHNDNPLVKIDGPLIPTNNIGTDTEVEITLPLTNCWGSDSTNSTLLINLEQYYNRFKLFKRNIEFNFAREVI